MDVLVLAIKAALALTLLTAGSAKLADVTSFAATVRLFVPRRVPGFAVRGVAAGAGLAEVLIGTASFSFPASDWVNVVVLGAGCTFVVLSGAGYLFHRGVACRCFGRLSRRSFDAPALARSLGIAGLAAVVAVSTVSPGAIRLTAVAHVLLLATAALLAAATFTAARALGAVAEVQPPVAATAP
jgi:hypothetical protein